MLYTYYSQSCYGELGSRCLVSLSSLSSLNLSHTHTLPPTLTHNLSPHTHTCLFFLAKSTQVGVCVPSGATIDNIYHFDGEQNNPLSEVFSIDELYVYSGYISFVCVAVPALYCEHIC